MCPHVPCSTPIGVELITPCWYRLFDYLCSLQKYEFHEGMDFISFITVTHGTSTGPRMRWILNKYLLKG